MKCETCGQEMERRDSTLPQSFDQLEAYLYECPGRENMDGKPHFRRWERKPVNPEPCK